LSLGRNPSPSINLQLASTALPSLSRKRVRALLDALNNKYVSIDLSGCTGTEIGNISSGSASSRYRDRLVEVILPEGLTFIRALAFSYCTSLEQISLPASLTFIGDNAFAYCTSLVSVTFESGSSILSGNFGSNAFPEGGSGLFGGSGDNLKTAYLAEGADTYTREANGSVWTKQ
jgi:hypothetical protein